MKIQKTFQEDDDISGPFEWIDKIIWPHVNIITHADPADMEHRLANKIKITIEVYGEIKED
jgi:hypothetical protein